ncbi:MAG TPA: ATP-binding protein [Bacteroidota bacterium]
MSTADPLPLGATPPAEPSPTGPLKVLLVDDVPENLALLEDVLSENGYDPVLTRNGLEALQYLRACPVHLIVADAMMPKMDGFQLCKEVKAQTIWTKIPFIIYTGNYVDGADQEFARSIGVDRYVVKYAGLGTLLQAVNELAQERYGFTSAPVETPERIDDQVFLEKHHAIIIKKLEEKMAELEMYAETLISKNREIQASEDRYRSLFDNASIAIYVIDRNSGKVLDANKQGRALLGATREQLLALPVLPFVDPGDVSQRMRGADIFSSGEAAIRKANGDTLDVEVGVGPLTSPDENRVLLYVRDVTVEKKMREKLMQAEKMSLMGRLAAGIAHEIRNPLAAVTLNLQFLLQRHGLEEAVRSLINDALDGARRVESVMENTLSLARITPPVLKPEQINGLTEQALGFLRISAQQKKIQVETLLAPDLPQITVDAKQIQQVMLNVMQNAVDASSEGGLLTVATGIIEEPVRGQTIVCPCVVMTVRDRGVGMTDEQYKRLFEHFHTTKPGGTGLGLAMSKQIMLRHNGEITVEPAPGSGTIVRLLFPANR